MKKNRVFTAILLTAIVIIMGIGIGQVSGKSIPKEIKSYIGQPYEDLPKELKEEGFLIERGENDEVVELLINKAGYTVDNIQIGDPIEKIYKVYPKAWIHSRAHTIQVVHGTDNHYGVATDYVIYTIGKKNQIQSILLGKVVPFINGALPSSNAIAQELIQGEWISKMNHKVVFKSNQMKDNYLDSLWEKQSYIVFSPNTLIIYREKASQIEKVKIHFWVSERKLYLFTIDQQGKPIKDSIEVFNRT